MSLEEKNLRTLLDIAGTDIFMHENMPEQHKATDLLIKISGQISPRARYSRHTWKLLLAIVNEDNRNLIKPVHADFERVLDDLCNNTLKNPQDIPEDIFTLRRTEKGEKTLLLVLADALENNKAEDLLQKHLESFCGLCFSGRKAKALELREKAATFVIGEDEIDPVEAHHTRSISCEI